uniref:Uncharacterized protein n=1 Tax=Oryza punctata TaxID=4537 RepID=A0A0E0MIA7_ORYPU
METDQSPEKDSACETAQTLNKATYSTPPRVSRQATNTYDTNKYPASTSSSNSRFIILFVRM